MTKEQIWQLVLAEIELGISKPNFTTWFRQTGVSLFEDGNVVICVPNTFTKSWLEKKYHSSILSSLERVSGTPIQKILYKVEVIKKQPIIEQPVIDLNNTSINPSTNTTTSDADKNTEKQQEHSIIQPRIMPNRDTMNSGMNSKYVFETFIVGKNNELAHAAAQAVSTRPGEAYNPLFIYGGVGLGKTHLLQAIGNKLLQEDRINKAIYVTCEKFTNDFLNSVRTGNAKEFKNRYRNVDLLIIDDIQFIAGKERTQEEFFHTFNELHQSTKQIVLSSDRPPKAIELEERLKSRFEWGMIADVAKPDLETRVAILESKCNAKGFKLDRNLLHLIADVVQNNIRELEGALNKVVAYHELKKIAPSTETLSEILSNVQSSKKLQPCTPSEIIDIVAEFYGIQIKEVLGPSREKRLAFPRQISMFLLREYLSLSYPAIGTALGGRDHTTAIHAHTKISTQIQENQRLKQEIEALKTKIASQE